MADTEQTDPSAVPITQGYIEEWLRRYGLEPRAIRSVPMRLVVWGQQHHHRDPEAQVYVQVPIIVLDPEAPEGEFRPLIDRQAGEVVTDTRTIPFDLALPPPGELTEYVEPDVERTHVTIIDGEVRDAHMHSDAGGESPATPLPFVLVKNEATEELRARTWSIDTPESRVIVTVAQPPDTEERIPPSAQHLTPEPVEAPPNEYLVAMGGGVNEISVVRIGLGLTREQAIGLAAWLSVLADPMGDDFAATLEAVRNT